MTLKSAYESAMVGKFNAEKAGPYKVTFEASRDDWKALIDHGNAFFARADAQTRMTWADVNKIYVDYSTEFTAASTAMAESKTAYEGKKYLDTT